MRIDRSEDVKMTRTGKSSPILVSAVLFALILPACAPTAPGMTSADPARSAQNQKKQAELQKMEKEGQRD